jgi:hypothetical protein
MSIENLLFILLIVMAGLFRLLATKAGEAKKRREDLDRRPTTSPSAGEPIKRAPVESDAERIRRFLEALGQPTGSRPPPPVVPRTDVPPRPLAPVKPPIARVWELTREELRRRKVIVEEKPPVESAGDEGKIAAPKPTVPPPVEFHAEPLPAESPSIAKTPVEPFAAATAPTARKEELRTDIVTLLASTSGLRSAIILREIFGPPRSLQPLDLVGSA